MKTTVLAFVAVGTGLVAVGPLPANSAPAGDGPTFEDQQTVSTPPADGTFRTGPALAPACTGVPIRTTDNAAKVVDDAPTGTTFCFTTGWHRITETIHPKVGQQMFE